MVIHVDGSLEVDNYYIITFNVNDETLTYSCKILSIDETFITFTDRYGNTISYNKSLIMSYKLFYPEKIKEVFGDI